MASANHVERARQEGVLLGIPLGDLGWFQSLLLGTAAGFAAFFATTFVAIMSFLFYAAFTHRTPDYALTYKRIGFPVGMVVLLFSLSFLGIQWVRRMKRRSARQA